MSDRKRRWGLAVCVALGVGVFFGTFGAPAPLVRSGTHSAVVRSLDAELASTLVAGTGADAAGNSVECNINLLAETGDLRAYDLAGHALSDFHWYAVSAYCTGVLNDDAYVELGYGSSAGGAWGGRPGGGGEGGDAEIYAAGLPESCDGTYSYDCYNSSDWAGVICGVAAGWGAYSICSSSLECQTDVGRCGVDTVTVETGTLTVPVEPQTYWATDAVPPNYAGVVTPPTDTGSGGVIATGGGTAACGDVSASFGWDVLTDFTIDLNAFIVSPIECAVQTLLIPDQSHINELWGAFSTSDPSDPSNGGNVTNAVSTVGQGIISLGNQFVTALSSTGDYSSDCDDYHAGSPTDGPCAGTQGCWGLYYQLTGDSDASFDISPCTVAADVQGTADWYGGGDLWTVVSDVILATAWLAMAVEVFWMLSKLLGDK